MNDFDFDKIKYRSCRHSSGGRYISEVVGLDSEAYQDGFPFMFATQLGDVWTLDDLPECLFSRVYRGKHFVTYNLGYDSGALTYNLPNANKTELWQTLKTEHNGYKYRYIPGKLLRIAKGKNSAKIWDIYQFYAMGLNAAAAKYLGKAKLESDVQLYTPEYVNANWEEVSRYCIHDAELAGELGKYLIDRLESWGIKVASLYSVAAISLKYFEANSNLVTVDRFWRDHKELLQFATEAYKGGKFEVTARGSCYGVEYDINSAYPSEIASLIDIRHAKVVHSPEYQTDAIYGFLRVDVLFMPPICHPIAVKEGNVNIYPVGDFSSTITKGEYDYLIPLGAKLRIRDAYWLKVLHEVHPYKEIVEDLYRKKAAVKNQDAMEYNLVKIMLNGFYGKMVQLIRQPDGSIQAGSAWNPIFGAVITANVRIRMCEIQNQYWDHCIATHTDSVILTERLPEGTTGKALGQWDLVREGETTIVSCGIYQVADASRFRGFPVSGGQSLREILQESGRNQKVTIPVFTIESWISAVHRGKFSHINLPQNIDRVMDLNSDSKRVWVARTNAAKLLTSLDYSFPIVLSNIGNFHILNISEMDRLYSETALLRDQPLMEIGHGKRQERIPRDRREYSMSAEDNRAMAIEKQDKMRNREMIWQR